jgi:hypothetical protein
MNYEMWGLSEPKDCDDRLIEQYNLCDVWDEEEEEDENS